MRVRFSVVEPQTISIVARQVQGTFEPYTAKSGGRTFDLLQSGTHSDKEMFAQAKQANETMTWVIRVVGFVIMAAGIYMVFRPLAVLADAIPFVGGLLNTGVLLFALVIAAILSLLTIAVSWVVVRPLLGISLLAVVALMVVGVVFLFRRKRPA
jgi:hypothetical protein